MKRRQWITAATAVAAGAALNRPAWAQTFPSRPLTIIVPTGPGGGYDQVARLIGDVLPARIGQSVVVDNRTGAGTRLGTQAAAVATPDGYTLLLGGLSNMVFNAALYPNLNYDPVKNFVPVGLVARMPYLLVARSDLPAASVKDLIAMIRAAPDKFTIGTAGNGTGQHVMAVAFARSIGVNITLVPYKSAGAVYQDLLGGRVDLFADALNTARPHVESKRAKAMVITSAKRDPQFPDVPTVEEAGLPLMRLDTWFGLYAPSKTPAPVLDKLRTALHDAFEDPALHKRMDAMGYEAVSYTPPRTDAFLQGEYAKWTSFIKAQGITGD